MNWNQMEGNWEQFKGKVQSQWGKLTGDDLDVIKGNRKQLTGKIQERYPDWQTALPEGRAVAFLEPRTRQGRLEIGENLRRA
jgi:uncharacterized protein YjbJ (UPF0337 family)